MRTQTVSLVPYVPVPAVTCSNAPPRNDYWLYLRAGGCFYLQDAETGKRTSLRTTDRLQAERWLNRFRGILTRWCKKAREILGHAPPRLGFDYSAHAGPIGIGS